MVNVLPALCSAGLFVLPAVLAVVSPEGIVHIDATSTVRVWPLNSNETSPRFSIDCVNCGFTGDLSFSAGGGLPPSGFEPDANFTSALVNASGFDFTQFWVGVVFDSFTINYELLVQLSDPSITSNEFSIPIDVPVKLPIPVFGLVISWEPVLHGWVNTSAAVNFTQGIEIVVPKGSALIVSLSDLTKTVAVGFPDTTIQSNGFGSVTAELDLKVEFGFQPSFSASLAPPGLGNLSVSAFANLPVLDLTVGEVLRVNAHCETPDGQDKVFDALTKVDFSADLHFEIDVPLLNVPAFDLPIPIAKHIPSECYQYDNTTHALDAPGTSSDNGSGSSGGSGGDSGGSDNGGSGATLAMHVSPLLLGVALVPAFFYL